MVEKGEEGEDGGRVFCSVLFFSLIVVGGISLIVVGSSGYVGERGGVKVELHKL